MQPSIEGEGGGEGGDRSYDPGDGGDGRDGRDARMEPLVLDLLEWVARGPRPYAEVMDAGRTSCPRLAVWEEAVARGLLVSQAVAAAGVVVAITPLELGVLKEQGRLRR